MAPTKLTWKIHSWIYFLYVCFADMKVCDLCVYLVPREVRKGCWVPETSYGWLWGTMWLLRTESSKNSKCSSSLSHLPSPHSLTLKTITGNSGAQYHGRGQQHHWECSLTFHGNITGQAHFPLHYPCPQSSNRMLASGHSPCQCKTFIWNIPESEP